MAKKKAAIGIVTYIKTTPRKRPGRHAKSFNKRTPHRKRNIGQG
jgi:hypothetical protein